MSTEKATDFCRRKQQLLQREQSAVQKEVASRRNALGQVTAVLQDKVRALQASGS
jgi:peptidoglycan hydrolase CwlO-like protein